MVKKETEEKYRKEENKKPIQYVMGNLKIAMFENTNEDGETFNSFKIQKFYKEKEEWKTTESLDLNSLCKLPLLINGVLAEVLPVVEKLPSK